MSKISDTILEAIREHYIKCRLSHPTNGGNGGAVKRDAGGPAPRGR